MFNFSTKEQDDVSKIMRLQIALRLDKINDWIEGDLEGALVDKEFDASRGYFEANGMMVFEFDLLPHPNGRDTIFYHHHTCSFSNHLDAELFTLIEKVKGKEVGNLEGQDLKRLANNVTNIRWTLQAGYVHISAAIKDKNSSDLSEEIILTVPVEEIAELQLGNRVSGKDEELINVDWGNDSEEKIKRLVLGIGKQGIVYCNKLCQVKAYIPDEVAMYR